MNKDLCLSSYKYNLPPELIASRPATARDQSRLLVYDEATDKISHHYFHELVDLLAPKTHLVFNQSKVIPCRLNGKRSTGGGAEIFFIRPVNDLFEVMIKSNSKKKPNDIYQLPGEVELKIIDRLNDMTFLVSINTPNILDYLHQHGSIPLPHYIRGGVADAKDREDYQTTYAKEAGSLAAPTAGLHFSEKVFDQLAQKKIHQSYLTLHVGLGTFSPIRSENILEHKMHEEYFNIEAETLKTLNAQKQNLIAVGTTTLRALQSSFGNNAFQARPTGSKTNIFLHPGKEIKSITGLITNFHLPESSLLILVSALLGREKTLEIYHNAIENKYRFFSYGDAMFIRRKISE